MLADFLSNFLKAIDCCFAKTVNFFGTLAATVFELTSSIKKRLCMPSDWVYSDYVYSGFVFCFLNGTLADLVKAVDCFDKLTWLWHQPLAFFKLISITALLGDFSAH